MLCALGVSTRRSFPPSNPRALSEAGDGSDAGDEPSREQGSSGAPAPRLVKGGHRVRPWESQGVTVGQVVGGGLAGVSSSEEPHSTHARRQELLSRADAFNERVQTLLGGAAQGTGAGPDAPVQGTSAPRDASGALVQRLRAEAVDAVVGVGWGGPGADCARKSVFEKVDQDRSGYLDRGEIAHALQGRGLPASEADVGAILAAMDTDGDGKVSYDEFARAIGEPTVEEIKGKEQWLKEVGLVRALALRLPHGPLEQSMLLVKDWGGLIRDAAADMALKADEAALEMRRSIEARRDADQMNAKFAASQDLAEASYGKYPEDYDKGLDAVVGVPSLQVLDAMEREHCEGHEADKPFDTHYSKGAGSEEKDTTTMKLEWEIAVKPQEGKAYPGQRSNMKPLSFFLRLVGVEGWSIEDEGAESREELQLHALRTELAPRLENAKLSAAVRAEGATMSSVDAAVGTLEEGRTVRELAEEQLARWKGARLRKEEVIAVRLYTSPAFSKYNALLRGGGSNAYANTIHAINSALIKLSTVTVAPGGRKVWRGMSGRRLAEGFLKPDAFGFRGGVERGFFSTTTNVDVAKDYSVKGQNPIVWEMVVGQVDRGASIAGLSEYPGEAEILFPPLSNLEVIGDPEMDRRGDDLVMVVKIKVNANNKGLTIDQLQERRKSLHMDLCANVLREVERDLAPSVLSAERGDDGAEAGLLGDTVSKVLEECRSVLADHKERDASWYAEDGQYKQAIVEAVDLSVCAKCKVQTVTAEGLQDQKRNQWMNLSVVHFVDRGSAIGAMSGYGAFPWSELLAGKVPRVAMFVDMDDLQIDLAWQCCCEKREIVEEVRMGNFSMSRPFDAFFKAESHLSFQDVRGPTGMRLLGGLLRTSTYSYITGLDLS